MIGFDTAMLSREIIEKTEVFLKRKFDAADEMWKERLSFQISFYEKLVRQFESSERVQ